MVLSNKARVSGHKLKHRIFQLNIRKHFYSESGQTLEQGAQGGYEVSILGIIHNMIGSGMS